MTFTGKEITILELVAAAQKCAEAIGIEISVELMSPEEGSVRIYGPETSPPIQWVESLKAVVSRLSAPRQ